LNEADTFALACARLAQVSRKMILLPVGTHLNSCAVPPIVSDFAYASGGGRLALLLHRYAAKINRSP
jgi:hypothetical protein